MTSTPPADSRQGTVVLLGVPADDGVRIKIQSLGYRYARRVLASNPENWLSIIKQLRELNASELSSAIVMMWSDETIDRAILPDHREASHALMSELAQVPTIAFVYQEVLDRILSESAQVTTRNDDSARHFWNKHKAMVLEFPAGNYVNYKISRDYRERFEQILGSQAELLFYPGGGSVYVSNDQFPEVNALLEEMLIERNKLARQFLQDLRGANVEVVPYLTRVDRIVRTEQFLEAKVRGEFLRLYIPSGRYQAEQLASFLRLFENYLRRIEGRAFGIDTHRTRQGTLYVFRSDDEVATLEGIEDAVARFESLLALYSADPQKAEELLAGLGVVADEARGLLARYERDYRRLVLDMKHEYESKLLLLRQALENQALDLVTAKNQAIPPVSSNEGIPGTEAWLPHPSLNLADSTKIDPQVEELINTEFKYTLAERELIDLIEKHESGLQVLHLKSQLDQLKDLSIPDELQIVARQELVGFLYRMMPRLGQSVVMDYIAYLKSLPSSV